jgi:hypothetical protein
VPFLLISGDDGEFVDRLPLLWCRPQAAFGINFTTTAQNQEIQRVNYSIDEAFSPKLEKSAADTPTPRNLLDSTPF